MAQATAPVLDSTCAPTARITSGGRFDPESKVRHVRRLTTGRKSHHSDTYRWPLSIARFVAPASCPQFPGIGSTECRLRHAQWRLSTACRRMRSPLATSLGSVGTAPRSPGYTIPGSLTCKDGRSGKVGAAPCGGCFGSNAAGGSGIQPEPIPWSLASSRPVTLRLSQRCPKSKAEQTTHSRGCRHAQRCEPKPDCSAGCSLAPAASLSTSLCLTFSSSSSVRALRSW